MSIFLIIAKNGVEVVRFQMRPQTTVQELVEAYCQRSHLAPDTVLLRSRRLQRYLMPQDTPDSLALQDLDIIDVDAPIPVFNVSRST